MEAGINSVMLKLEEGVDMKHVSVLVDNGANCSHLVAPKLTIGCLFLVHGSLHVCLTPRAVLDITLTGQP